MPLQIRTAVRSAFRSRKAGSGRDGLAGQGPEDDEPGLEALGRDGIEDRVEVEPKILVRIDARWHVIRKREQRHGRPNACSEARSGVERWDDLHAVGGSRESCAPSSCSRFCFWFRRCDWEKAACSRAECRRAAVERRMGSLRILISDPVGERPPRIGEAAEC